MRLFVSWAVMLALCFAALVVFGVEYFIFSNAQSWTKIWHGICTAQWHDETDKAKPAYRGYLDVTCDDTTIRANSDFTIDYYRKNAHEITCDEMHGNFTNEIKFLCDEIDVQYNSENS